MSNTVRLFDIEKIKVSDASATNKKILITSTIDNGISSLKKVLNILKTNENLVLRIYFHEIDDDLFNSLSNISNVELTKYYPYELSDPITNSLGVFSSLLRYLPLFYKEDNFKYAIVIDLDSKEEIIDEFISYLDQVKTHDFVYSCRKWYRSTIYWYENMAHKSFYHIVKGCGMGFKLGLLNPEIFLNFVRECSIMLDTNDECIYKFKKLSIVDINDGKSIFNPFTSIIDCETFPRGTVELFTTFYILPTMLKSKYSIMRINVQNKILHCLAYDLIRNAKVKERNSWFVNEFNMQFDTFIRHFKNCSADDQRLWTKFLAMVSRLHRNKFLVVDENLLSFVLKENRMILTKDNNKTVLTQKDREELHRNLFGISLYE